MHTAKGMKNDQKDVKLIVEENLKIIK